MKKRVCRSRTPSKKEKSRRTRLREESRVNVEVLQNRQELVASLGYFAIGEATSTSFIIYLVSMRGNPTEAASAMVPGPAFVTRTSAATMQNPTKRKGVPDQKRPHTQESKWWTTYKRFDVSCRRYSNVLLETKHRHESTRPCDVQKIPCLVISTRQDECPCRRYCNVLLETKNRHESTRSRDRYYRRFHVS